MTAAPMTLSDAMGVVRDAAQAEFVALRSARDTVIRTAPSNAAVAPAMANIDERVFKLHGARLRDGGCGVTMSHDFILALAAPNERRDRLGLRKPLQDHAVALRRADACVVAVADGVSVTGDGLSVTQCGAGLAAEVAALAAVEAASSPLVACPAAWISSGEAACARVSAAVGSALAATFQPIAGRLGEVDAPRLLLTTLILGVRTPGWTAVWALGDGFAGILFDGGDDSVVVREGVLFNGPPTGPRSVSWGRHLDRLRRRETLPFAVFGGPMPWPSLVVRGPTNAVWVATDGLRDEWALGLLLMTKGTPRVGDAVASLERRAGADDLGFACAGDIGWALSGCEVPLV